MSEFKEIKTQEEFNEAIKDRLERQKETIEKQYADYDQLKTRNAELETEVTGLQAAIEETGQATKVHEQTVAELNAKLADHETASLRTKIALQHGLPIDLADRIVGNDEASIKADAERLAAFVKPKDPIAPLKNTEPALGDGKDTAYKNLLENLDLEGE
ncbi:capsid assembly scaffolding protein Gp46 family protein [Enterococcus rotai]|uniref:capsid assembly scaffolding protein Gp46 family protein n=1 Tax=Enterococcus rotai TaxID=118060 RepID=UPI0032B4A1CA